MLFTFRGTNPLVIPTFGFQLHTNRMKGLSIYLKAFFGKKKLSLDTKNIILYLFWTTSIGFVSVLVLHLFWLTSIVFVPDLVLHLFDLQALVLLGYRIYTCSDLQVSALFNLFWSLDFWCDDLQAFCFARVGLVLFYKYWLEFWHVSRNYKGDYYFCFYHVIAHIISDMFCLALFW